MSHEPKAGNHLDPEMLAAYIDKRLSPEQRAQVEAQLASDPDAYAVLVESMKALDALDDQRTVPYDAKKKASLVRWAVAAGTLAAAAALLLVVMQPDWLTADRDDRLLKQLTVAVANERTVEGRLADGFNYAPLRQLSRGRDSQPQNLNLVAASAAAQNAASDSAKGLRVTGVAKLLIGDVDGGVAALEDSVRREPVATTLADLSAAYLLRASNTLAEADLRLALETATRALSKSPDNPEALYNRALAAEKLGLPDAVAYWQATIDKTAPSAWRDDAQRHLAAVRSRQ